MTETIIKMSQNFLTKKPERNALNSTLLLILVLLYSSFAYLNGLFNADEWMHASGAAVFQNGQYWRAWTALFAHGDFGHIASNLFLFIPFAYFLTGYFGYIFFPFFGFLAGGFINLLVLKTMPPEVGLVGVSGVVYWMGAAWMTLSFFIERRESNGRNLVKIIGISAILFVPDSFKKEVSYLSHFLGYFLGILSGALYYLVNRSRIRGHDEFIEIVERDEVDENAEKTDTILTETTVSNESPYP